MGSQINSQTSTYQQSNFQPRLNRILFSRKFRQIDRAPISEKRISHEPITPRRPEPKSLAAIQIFKADSSIEISSKKRRGRARRRKKKHQELKFRKTNGYWKLKEGILFISYLRMRFLRRETERDGRKRRETAESMNEKGPRRL